MSSGALIASHSKGQIDINASDGSIEITRGTGDAFIDFKNSTSEDFDARIAQDGTAAALIVTGELRNQAVASAWIQFNGTGTVTNYSDLNVSTITEWGVGDYQINYTNQLKNAAGNTTDYQAVSLSINGSVYNVPGQLAHTHAFTNTADKNHVRFQCYKDENSGMRADQTYVGVIVFS